MSAIAALALLAAAPSAQVADSDLMAAVRGLADALVEIRGEALPRPPVALRASIEAQRVVSEVRARGLLPAERLAARGRAWEDVGLGPPDTPGRLLALLAADLDGAVCDADSGRILVEPGRLSPTDFAGSGEQGPSAMIAATGVRPDEPLLMHLLVHLLQRNRGELPAATTTDALLADAAWHEGEANVLAVGYLFGAMGIGGEVLRAGLDPQSVLDGTLVSPATSATGDVLGRLVDFVYKDGFEQTAAAVRERGWPAVGPLAAARRSTRDVLHPGRSPIGATDPVPADWTPPDGYREVDRDVVGEQGIIAIVSVGSGKDNLGLMAGDGWAGDGLYRFETPGDPVSGITLWVTRWSDGQAAGDFDYGLLRVLSVRFPDAPVERLEDGVRVVRAGKRLYRVERRSGAVRLLVTSIP